MYGRYPEHYWIRLYDDRLPKPIVDKMGSFKECLSIIAEMSQVRKEDSDYIRLQATDVYSGKELTLADLITGKESFKI